MGLCTTKQKKTALGRVPTVASVISKTEISGRTILSKITEYYDFVRVLGHGQFGVVREAARHEGGRAYAVKTISKHQIGSDNIQNLRRELDLLVLLDHPNIIKLHQVFEDQKYIHIVTDLCTGGDLLDRLLKTDCITESQAAKIMQKLLVAVSHMHSSKVVHRDIKPDNVLFVDSSPESDIKLIDLGLAIGTPYYVAPEVLNMRYGPECDVWSLGVMLYILLCGCPPFDGQNKGEVFHAIKNRPVYFSADEWRDVSSTCKDLIRRMLIKDPAERITIAKALEHKWLCTKLAAERPRKVRLVSTVNHLRTYHAPKRLRAEGMKVIIKHMPQEDLDHLKDVFNALDKGNTGYITANDLRQALEDVGHANAAQEITHILSEVDYLAQGRINYTEFLQATINFKEQITDQVLYEAFQLFDMEQKGYITKEDLRQSLARDSAVSADAIAKMIEDYKFRNPNRIEFTEFRRMMFTDSTPTPDQLITGQICFGQMADAHYRRVDSTTRNGSGGIEPIQEDPDEE